MAERLITADDVIRAGACENGVRDWMDLHKDQVAAAMPVAAALKLAATAEERRFIRDAAGGRGDGGGVGHGDGHGGDGHGDGHGDGGVDGYGGGRSYGVGGGGGGHGGVGHGDGGGDGDGFFGN